MYNLVERLTGRKTSHRAKSVPPQGIAQPGRRGPRPQAARHKPRPRTTRATATATSKAHAHGLTQDNGHKSSSTPTSPTRPTRAPQARAPTAPTGKTSIIQLQYHYCYKGIAKKVKYGKQARPGLYPKHKKSGNKQRTVKQATNTPKQSRQAPNSQGKALHGPGDRPAEKRPPVQTKRPPPERETPPGVVFRQLTTSRSEEWGGSYP